MRCFLSIFYLRSFSMQIPFKLSAILIAGSFVLTACGSSSSGEPTKIEENSFGVKVSTSAQKATFDTITVDGQEIPLADAELTATQGNPNSVHPVFVTDAKGEQVERYNINVKDATKIASIDSNNIGTESVNAHSFEYAIVGAVKTDNGEYLFIQGEKTPINEIPKTGSFYYTGGTLRFVTAETVDKGSLFQETGVLTGRIEATVNFDDKTIDGYIRDAGRNAEQEFFEGKISGNGFTTTWTDGDTGSLKGNFYGDATEIAGEFERSDSFGVFIAEQTATE
ncbi:hypothetical protein E0709_02605 [Lonepinella koalarum]|nr:hypothetical protein E0709_02605 [Lonepinella koalarum]